MSGIDPGVRELLDERRVDPRLIELLDGAAQSWPVGLCGAPELAPLPLSTEDEAYAAVYLGQTVLSLALDREEAVRAVRQHGFGVEERNDTTHYLKVSAAALRDPAVAAAATQLVSTALARAHAGPRWQRGIEAGQTRYGETCPACQEQRALNGSCACDD